MIFLEYRLSRYFIGWLFPQDDKLSKEEQAYLQYYIEVIIINLTKVAFILIVSLIFDILVGTAITLGTFIMLRKYAFGWHAKSSINCSLIGVISFVGIPLLISKWGYSIGTLNFSLLLLLLLISLLIIYKYSPADTENNPIIEKSIRYKLRSKALGTVFLLYALVLFIPMIEIKIFLLLGIWLELIVITPVFYKIMKRGFKNYEKYTQE